MCGKKDGIVEVGRVLRLCGQRCGAGLPPGADGDFEGILGGTLFEDPLGGVVFGAPAAVHAHDAEGDGKAMPFSTGEEIIEGFPIVDVFLWLEIRPDEARIDGADVDDLFQSLQGRFAAHR